jgi:hypothetical protein
LPLTFEGFGGKGGATLGYGECWSMIVSIWSIQECNIDNNEA